MADPVIPAPPSPNPAPTAPDKPADAPGTGDPTNPPDETTGPIAAKDAAPKKKYKLKRGKTEVEVDEDHAIHLAQKGYGAESMLNEAKAMYKEAQAIQAKLEALKDPKNRRQVARELIGAEELRALAEEEAYEAMQQERALEKMPPTERALLKAYQDQQKRLEEFQAQAQKQQLERQQAEQEIIVNSVRAQLETAIREATDSLKFPDTLKPAVVRRILPHIQAALESGIEVQPQALAAFATQEMREEFQAVANALDGPALVGWLGEGLLTKLRKYDLAEYHKRRQGHGIPQPGQVQPTNGSSGMERPNGQKSNDPYERWKYINSL